MSDTKKETARENKGKQQKLADERKKANDQVSRNYKLKVKK